MRSSRLVLPLLLAAGLSLFAARASAGGFYLTDRGTEALGRGGAFVAGAKGLDALWYNPAGLAGSGRTFHLDATVTLLDASFQRVDDVGKVRPTVTLDATPIPVPLLGYADDFGIEDWDFAFGLFAPNAQPYRWPTTVDGAPAPQRYSLIATDKSLITHLALGAAYSGIKGLSLGATAQLVTGRFYTETVLSACDGFACSANTPEDPEFDTYTTIDLKPFFSFTGSLGVTYEVAEVVKLGASFILPYDIAGDATIEATLPDSPVFDRARLDGDRVELTVPFPAIARIGVELLLVPSLRVELSGVYEGWSRQRAITVVPKDVWMRDLLGIGDYRVGTIRLDRGMQDVWSARLGGEYLFERAGVTTRAGLAYENGAFSDRTLSPLTLDSSKLLIGLGAGFALPYDLSVDIVAGHVFMANREIDNSRITQPTAIRPEPGMPSHIANGKYEMEATFFGLGATYRPQPTQDKDR